MSEERWKCLEVPFCYVGMVYVCRYSKYHHKIWTNHKKKKKKKKATRPTLFENFMLLQYNNFFFWPNNRGKIKDRRNTLIYSKSNLCKRLYNLWKFYMISTFCTKVASTYSTTPSEPFCPRTKIGANCSKWQLLIKTPYKLIFSIQQFTEYSIVKKHNFGDILRKFGNWTFVIDFVCLLGYSPKIGISCCTSINASSWTKLQV